MEISERAKVLMADPDHTAEWTDEPLPSDNRTKAALVQDYTACMSELRDAMGIAGNPRYDDDRVILEACRLRHKELLPDVEFCFLNVYEVLKKLRGYTGPDYTDTTDFPMIALEIE